MTRLLARASRSRRVAAHTLDPMADARWADLVTRSPRASVFHSVPWLRALHDTYGYQPLAITDAPPGSRVDNALVFCVVDSPLTGRRLVGLPFSDHCEALVESDDVLCGLLDDVRHRMAEQRLRYVELRPRVARAPVAGFVPSAAFSLHVIDLSDGPAAVYARFDKNHVQRSIRKAERLGVAVETGRADRLLREFYALHVLTRARHATPVQPFAWFSHLATCFGDALRVYLARVEGQPAAAILTLDHGATLVYKYGCSDSRFNKFGATSLLFWRAAQAGMERGAREFDLGRTDLDNPGLLAYKDRLGAARTELRYHRTAGAGPQTQLSWFDLVARRAYGLVPSRVSRWAGSRLYRHFG